MCSGGHRDDWPGWTGLPHGEGIHLPFCDNDCLTATEEVLSEELIVFVLASPSEVLLRIALLVTHDALGSVVGEAEGRSLLPDIELLTGVLRDLALPQGSIVSGVVDHAGGFGGGGNGVVITFTPMTAAEAVAPAISVDGEGV